VAKLARAVIVRDPNRHRDLVFNEGEEPGQEYAVLIRNPACWEGGKLPAAVKRAIAAQETDSEASVPTQAATDTEGPTASEDAASGGDSAEPGGTADDQAAPAAKKTAARKTAVTGRSRGRDAAGEGTSGE
jgi:hypothetical protein